MVSSSCEQSHVEWHNFTYPVMLRTNYQELPDMSVTGLEALFPFVSLLMFHHEWQIVLRGEDV